MSVKVWQAPNTWAGGGPASVTLITTEVRSSRLNSSILSIPQNLLLLVTETRSARFDKSILRTPVNWVDKPPVTTLWTDKA